MSKFKELLTELVSEYEQMECSLADARAALQACGGKNVAEEGFVAVKRPGGAGLKGPRALESAGARDGGTADADEDEEDGFVFQSWSRMQTPGTADEKMSLEPVAEEGPGLSVSPVAGASVSSRGASGPPAVAPIMFKRAPTDLGVHVGRAPTDHSFNYSALRSFSRLSLVPVGHVVSRQVSLNNPPWQPHWRCGNSTSERPSIAFVAVEAMASRRPSPLPTQLQQYTSSRPHGAQMSPTCTEVVHTNTQRGGRHEMASSDSLPSGDAEAMQAVDRRGRRSVGRSGARWVVNPEQSPNMEKWDQLTIVALAFVAIVTPVQVALLETKFDAMLFVNCVVDAIFFCDMILQFFLMYPVRKDYGQSYEARHSKIVVHYLRTWFPVDILSLVPFDLFAVLSNSEGLQQLKIVKAVRLMRLLKLIRVLKASRVFNRFETRMSITYGRLALLKFFVILSVITHWLAMLWALTLVMVDESEGFPRWVDALTDLEANVEVKTKDSPAKLYIACLYFTSYTITSVGYGDIGPKNILERVVLTFMLIVSGISWAVVLGQVCGIVANLDHDEQSFRSTMDELNAMMQDHLIPTTMRTRLRSFFLSNKTAQKRARHLNIMKAMSPGLRADVCLQINKCWLDKVNFLRQLLTEAQENHQFGATQSLLSFVLDTSLIMEQDVRAQGEHFGELHTMYILNRGLVGRHRRCVHAGAVWGLDFVLSDGRLLEPVNCFSLTYIELTTLSRTHFFEVVERHSRSFPEIYKTVRRHCCWLAFQRALMLEAKCRQELLEEQAKGTMVDVPSLSGARPLPQTPEPPLTP